jgi:hypothetical protein
MVDIIIIFQILFLVLLLLLPLHVLWSLVLSIVRLIVVITYDNAKGIHDRERYMSQ